MTVKPSRLANETGVQTSALRFFLFSRVHPLIDVEPRDRRLANADAAAALGYAVLSESVYRLARIALVARAAHTRCIAILNFHSKLQRSAAFR